MCKQEFGLVPNDLALDVTPKARDEHFNGCAHAKFSTTAIYTDAVGAEEKQTAAEMS